MSTFSDTNAIYRLVMFVSDLILPQKRNPNKLYNVNWAKQFASEFQISNIYSSMNTVKKEIE